MGLNSSTLPDGISLIWFYSLITPRPVSDSESEKEGFRTPPSVAGPDPFGMERVVETEPAVLEVLGEKNETIEDRFIASAARKRDLCVRGGHWIMKGLRAQPKIHNENGARKTDLGIGPGGREEEMGTFIAEGCVRTWGKKEMWFTFIL